MASATILIVEDDPAVRKTLEHSLTRFGRRVVIAESSEFALQHLRRALTDIEDPKLQLVPVILLTSPTDHEPRVGRAENMITSVGLALEARDPHTAGHSERISRYAVAMGQRLGLGEELLGDLRLGGLLHDLGKVAVPDEILLKPGPLSAAERERVKVHPGVGAELVQGMKTLDRVRPLIRHHHERCDGSGYPDRLRHDEIPLGARVLSVVDVYDALTSPRPYRKPISPDQAVDEVKRETDAGWWDPRIVAELPGLTRELACASRGTP